METTQIDKKELDRLFKKIDEIHELNRDKSQLREAVEILEAAIALNVSESTIYRVLNNSVDGDSQAINNSILKQRIKCDVRLVSDSPINNSSSLSPFKWTGSKSEIVEVIEAMLLIGSINDGNVTKKEFYEFIGNALQVDLSNHNNILDHIYNRKDDVGAADKRVKYLNKLTNAISRKLQERDSK